MNEMLTIDISASWACGLLVSSLVKEEQRRHSPVLTTGTLRPSCDDYLWFEGRYGVVNDSVVFIMGSVELYSSVGAQWRRSVLAGFYDIGWSRNVKYMGCCTRL